jgi:hypothetical protein
MTAFWTALFWEFVQNLPVIVAFVSAVWLWSRQERTRAAICAVVGAATGALVIRLTETMVRGGREPVAVTIVNILAFSLFQIVFAAYLGSQKRWSSSKTDLVLGGLGGAVLAAAQGLAAPEAPLIGIVLHSLSLAIAGSLVLVSIRALKGRTLINAILGSLLIVISITVVIGIVDYGYLLL